MKLAASLRSLRGVLAWFLILLLGGEFIQFSTAKDSNVTVPSEFTSNKDKLRNLFCDDCRRCTEVIWCTVCQWLCRPSWFQMESVEQTECRQTGSNSSTLCDEDQSTYCVYEDGAEVCTSDGNDDESCMYYDTSGTIYKSCLCDSDQGTFWVEEMRCRDKEMESTTAERVRSETLPTRQPLTTVTGAATSTSEPLTTGKGAASSTGEPLTTVNGAAALTDEPLATANVAAIVLGTLLAVLLIAVALGFLCLIITNKLRCGAGTGVTTADAAIEMAQNDNEFTRRQRSVASTNAYEDAPTRDSTTTDHAYKSLHLSHEQSHYYSRIPESGGNPNAHTAHTAQEEVTPSAPPTEGHELDTEAQEGHEYFVLEREQSGRSQADNSNHEYFVLEKDESPCEREVGRQEEGAEDAETLGKEVDSTINSKSAANYDGYDHIERSPQHSTTDNTYSHLNPPDPGKEYDHLSRAGKK